MIERNSKITPDFIESLGQNEVFVFGSNMIGAHADGASLMAMEKFGAVWGQAEGPQGQSYAIPVDIRGEAVENVSAYLKRHIDKFIAYAKDHQDQFFLVTRVGCGNAGFDKEFMAPFFKDAVNMENVSLPKEFFDILTPSKAEASIQRVFNLIILDESGSMQAIEKQAVSGLNETFETIRIAQKEHQEQRHFVSFVTFNSNQISIIMDRKPVESSKRITWNRYEPVSCTPLFDAMGQSINELKNHVAEEDVVLVTIITDGYENASKKYRGSDIKKLVCDLKEKGWVFAYIGTNQDVDAVADGMGIRSRMSYEYSQRGASDMFEIEHTSKRQFYSRLHHEGRNFMRAEHYDYFDVDSKKDPEDEPQKEPEAEPQKEPDIVWDVKNEDKATTETVVTSNSEDNCVVPEKPKGLWSKIINKLTLLLILFMFATTLLLIK